jgi:hypothetical protein
VSFLLQKQPAQKSRIQHFNNLGIKWVGVDPATGRDLLEKDGQVYDAATYARLFTAADWVPIGNNQPKAYGGFNNNPYY